MSLSPPSGTTARPIGSNYTADPRPCADCGTKHNALVLWTDGKLRCVACCQPLHRAIDGRRT